MKEDEEKGEKNELKAVMLSTWTASLGDPSCGKCAPVMLK
jgi:hypothetical protein